MLIATFNESTGWAGKAVSYDAGVFSVDGVGPVTVEMVMQYDSLGQLTWQAERTRAWAASLARENAGNKTRARTPVWVWAVVAGVVVVAAIVIAAGAMQSTGSTSSATPPDQTAGASQAAWVTVFTWPGGGEANDIRNSAPFALEGGHQRVTVVCSPLAAEYAAPLTGWTLQETDGGDGWQSINTGVNGGQSDCYLPAGTYYLSSNTIDCTWTVTVQEKR